MRNFSTIIIALFVILGIFTSCLIYVVTRVTCKTRIQPT